MKRFIIKSTVIALAVLATLACRKEELNPESVITVDKYEQNDFDKWLEVNFVNPYNIAFKYRYEQNESDLNYYTIPADYDLSIKMAHLVKYLCVDTYDEVAGIDFTRGYFPKMFFLIGEWEYRNNGTYILGTAEGGKKILLSGINYLDQVIKMGAADLNHYYIKTIHHEFTHILNQTREFPVDFKMVTGTGYVADSWSEYPFNGNRDKTITKEEDDENYLYYLKHGFISSYAQHSEGEDFAEMVSIYATNTQEYWDKQLASAGDGASLITTKLDIVRQYMNDSWGIDLEQLRSTINRRQNDVVSGKVDLDDITIK